MSNTGSILLFGSVLMAVMPAPAEGQKAFGVPTIVKGRVEDMAMVDQKDMAVEQQLAALIRSELQSGKESVGRLKDKKPIDLSPRAAALSALRKNLSIHSSRVLEDIAKAALLEAEAVFDPVLLLSFAYDHSETFDREETDLRFRRPTTQNAPDLPGRNILEPTDPVDTRNPRAEFDASRSGGFSPTTVIASRAPVTGPTESFTYEATLFQQLPWGADLTLAYQALDQDRFFVNNPLAIESLGSAENLVSFGSYDRPWVSSLLTRLTLPVPGSKDFGPYADQEVAIKLADLGKERAFWDVESIINATLLEVDLGYWDLVNRLLGLRVTIENREGVERLLAQTERLFELQEATNYDKAQIEAEVARVQGEEERAWDAYRVASNALVRLLDLQEDRVILPAGYSHALVELFPIPQEDAIAWGSTDNPDKAAASVDLRAARIEQQRRAVRVRPDINLVAEAVFRQSNRFFGYDSLGGSIDNVVDPDNVAQTYRLEYLYPWGNRVVKARLAQAQAVRTRQSLVLRATDNGIYRDLNNALVALASANERVAITDRNVQLAEIAYQKALQQQQLRVVTEYEVVEQNKRLLTARLGRIQAQTDRKRAEAGVLAALGIIASTYAKRSSQTEIDRHRLTLLEANRVLRHFGDKP
ncbi:MAG: TolC family protein [Gammaproteobacteria bacterium]